MSLHKLPFDLSNSDVQEIQEIQESSSESHESEAKCNLASPDAAQEPEVSLFPDALLVELKSELESFASENTILKNILVSTADGFEIASLLTPGYELHVRKVSALTSSLLGISSAMLKEVGKGEQNAVFMESDDSMILFNRITVNSKMLCLMAVTSKEEAIGQIFWRVRRLTDNLVNVCNKYM